jgi:exopolyphosphatase/guanosine-5'-triphosphate,3'-diphosphate pyrophosphatase
MAALDSKSSSLQAQTRRLAAIDIGSNSIRLLVAEAASDGTYRILDDEKRTTRLAKDLALSGCLAEQGMQQSVEALHHMKAIADGYEVDRLEVIATSAVREAANRERFLQLIRQRLGLKVSVISPTAEGQFSYASAARHFDLKPVNAVVVDLGGGSAELIFAAKGVIEAICSLPVGAVRLTDSFIRSDILEEADLRQLKKYIRKCFKKAVGSPDFVPQLMIGAGGTFMALANISMRRRGKTFGSVGGYEMTRSEVRHIFEYLRGLPMRERRDVPGLHADRADIILAGVLVIERLMKLLHVNRLKIHDQGVRDGLLQNMIGRTFRGPEPAPEPDGDALAGVRQFAAACTLDAKHSEHVTDLALQLFDQLRERLHLPAEERLLLQAAGLLHEVGYLINYERHHHHSYHIIMHGNLRGLSPKERELVANIARYHRRSTPKLSHDNYARLTPAERGTVRRLSAILRVADGFDRTHTQHVKALRCLWREGELCIGVVADRKPDVDLWSAAEKSKFFEKVFGVKLTFAWRPAQLANGRAK